MKIDPTTRRRLRLQNLVFTVLVLALVALGGWLTHMFSYTSDWTATGRHTLGDETRDVIALVDDTVEITAYIGPDAVTRRGVEALIERYESAGLELEFDFVNPEENPTLARELDLDPGGEVIIRLGNREQRLASLDEAELTNALARLARGEDRFIAFVEGHGERDPLGESNHDLGDFGEQLADRGIYPQAINLAATPQVPDNADLLVIAGPQSNYLPGEVAAIQRYLADGRNLLWLTEPEADDGLDDLAELLAIARLPGVVVDAGAQQFGAERPDFAVVTDYGEHPITADLDAITVFPQASALEAFSAEGWHHKPLLRTREQSWNETGPIEGRIYQDPQAGEVAGPLALGWAATRGPEPAHDEPDTQRVAVIGDGDFLSNAYVGNAGNLEFGMRLVRWLVADDDRVRIAPEQPADIELDRSPLALGIIGVGFLLVLPLVLLTLGAIIWWYRQKH